MSIIMEPAVKRSTPPLPDGLGVERVMAIGVEPQSTTNAGVADELAFGGSLDEVDEPAVGGRRLRADLGQRQAALRLRHAGVEGVDAAVADGVPRRRAAL